MKATCVQRAAQALRKRYGIEHGERGRAGKAYSGGGGSGAGRLTPPSRCWLSHLWRIETNARELAEIGAELGADVPFFFTGGTALGEGLGTEITRARDVSAEHLLIVTPGVRVLTTEAYRLLNAPALTKAEGDIILSISRAEAQIRGRFCSYGQ